MSRPAGLVIRPAITDADLDSWRLVRRTVLPNESTITIEQLRARESPHRLMLLAEVDGELAGHGFTDVSSYADGFVVPRILPPFRRHGIGSAVLEALVDHARSVGHGSVASLTDEEAALSFAVVHRFREIDRQVEQVRPIDADEPDPPPFPGVTFTTLAEDPSLHRDAWVVAEQGYTDMKLVTGPARVTFEEWLGEDATLPGGSIVALADGRIVGWAGLVAFADDPTRVENGLTAVDRAWRGRGLAAAMKRRQLRWAATHGITEIVTWTQMGNEAMQHVNVGLGYVTRSIAHVVRRDGLQDGPGSGVPR
jgi:GNAT superfamily N-acetyltransferase